MRIWAVFILVAVLFCNLRITDSTCELPTDLRGTWVDTFKGPLEFEATRITGYDFHTFGSLTLSCYQQDDTVYVMESSEFIFYGLNFTAYFCWNFTQVNDDMFYFYEYAAPVPDAGDERTKVYLPSLPRIYSSICSNPDVGLGTYRILFRNGTIEDAITECPSQINGNYKYDIKDETKTSTCNSSSNPLDACTNSSALFYNGTDCSIPLAYSESGSVYCLFNVEDRANKIHYMSLYNPGDVDETNTFSITCMILSYGSSSLTATQYPRQCPDNMNTSYVASPGAYVYLNSPSSCSAGSEFPWWIIGLALGLFLLICAIIFFLYYRKRKQEEEERKRRLLEMEDDERFDPDKFARGDRPPFVSITIMGDGRRRDKYGNLIDDEPPKFSRPKSEGGKRRLDKRKRVWVIGKDGQVKKVWKEAGESPDSGLEDDEIDGEGGGGSTGRKTLSSSRSGEKEDDDMAFSKKHGRKELKSAREIEEKGEKDRNSAKLMRKMKGMVSSRKSAKFRKSAKSARSRASGRMKSAAYCKDDDGNRSWGSDDGDFEEVDMENLQEVDDNKMNEEREKLGDDFVKPPKDQLDAVPMATVAMVSETEKKEGGKGRTGRKPKGKQKMTKSAATRRRADSTKRKVESTKSKQGELSDPLSTSGVVATAVVVDETKKQESKDKETSKKPQGKKDPKKKVLSKLTKRSTDTKVSRAKGGEHIEMEDKKEVKFKDEGGSVDVSPAETTAMGAAAGTVTATAAIAAATDSDKPEKTEAQLKAEQKKKEKEDAKRQKEEKKRQEKEAKEAKKKADAEAKETAKALTRYASVEETKAKEEKAEDTKKKEEEIIPSPKKDDLKPSGTDSGHVTPTSADNISKQDDTAPSSPSKDAPKSSTDAKGEKPPLPPQREPTLSSSMRPRREQSVLIEMDNSRSGSAGMTGDNKGSPHAPSSPKKDAPKSDTNAKDQKPPLPPSREPTLSSSMRPRREQSVLLELDNSRSGSASMTGENRDSLNASPGKGEKALGVVEELVDTARNKAEGADTTLDTSMVLPVPVPLLDLRSTDNDSLNDVGKSDTKRGDEVKGENKEKEKEEKKKTTEKKTEDIKSTTGAKTTNNKQKDVPKGVQIQVTEADKEPKQDDSKRHDVIQEEEEEEEEDDSSDDSSETEVPARNRKKPQGFMFMDQNNSDSAFKKAGDILHTMPVKKKTAKRKPRAAPVDIATTLPQRTNAAFGVTDKPKVKPAAAALARLKTPASKPAVPSKGPMTIKDISKKPPAENAAQTGQRETKSAESKSDLSPNRSRDPKDRKHSEVDPVQHLKIMTRLMSLAEGDEQADRKSRSQSGVSRQSRLDKAEMSARARAEEAAELDGLGMEPGESLETPDALLTARQGPILAGLPPTQHVYSRASSAGTRARSGVARSQSDSRQAWNPPYPDTTRTRNTHSSTSTNSEDRFVRFKEGVMKQLEELGQQEMNAIMYPRVQRYPEENAGPKRGTPAYKSMGTLQRIHKRNNKVGPLGRELPPIHGAYGRMIDDYDDTDDPRLKVLLEELYKDKKYMDKTLRENPEQDNFIRSRTMQGRSFLMNRARFWSTQQPLVRPGTQATSRSSTAMPPPFPEETSGRTRSEERPGNRIKE